MLTRFVRIQLIVFVVTSVVGIVAMALIYLQLPTLLGIGRMTVKVDLPTSGGLYRFGNATFRGVEIGKVTGIDLEPTKAVATLSLDSSVKIPSDVRAEVRSICAVGEQYVDLVPRRDGGPYLRDGSVIPTENVVVPQQVGPVLDQVSAVLDSVPRQRLGDLIEQTYQGLAGAGYDMGSLIDSTSTLGSALEAKSDSASRLVGDAAPLLDGQAQSADDLRTWTHSLAGITGQLVRNDPDVRTLLDTGPGFTNEVSALLNQLKPTLPVLLANLTSIGQVTMTYRPSIQQLLVMLPLTASSVQSSAIPKNNPTGIALSDFGISIGDPPVCTVGFLPPSEWRSPADVTETDTPDGLYCKLPQDSPISVRGARNSPCLEHPGKRAPTVQICNSDKPFEPLAMREHATGPYPIDPNLISQGIPPDSRATERDRLYAPIEGTPMPPNTPAASTPPGPAAPESPQGAQVPPVPEQPTPAPQDAPLTAAPAAFTPATSGPSMRFARYNVATGQYSTRWAAR